MSVSGGMAPDGGEAFSCSSTLTGSSPLDSTEYLLARRMLTEEEAPLGAPPVTLLQVRTTTSVHGVLLLGVEQEGC